jgi:uncharacterized protein (DUF1810 family)
VIGPYTLERFVEAQNFVYGDTLSKLRHGFMPVEFIDFIFPRLADCMPTPNRFGLRDLDDARAYLEFPVLGDRYRECVETLASHPDASACKVFGRSTGKVHASLTLFAESSSEVLFRTVLAVLFDNRVDEATILRLERTLQFC